MGFAFRLVLLPRLVRGGRGLQGSLHLRDGRRLRASHVVAILFFLGGPHRFALTIGEGLLESCLAALTKL